MEECSSSSNYYEATRNTHNESADRTENTNAAARTTQHERWTSGVKGKLLSAMAGATALLTLNASEAEASGIRGYSETSCVEGGGQSAEYKVYIHSTVINFSDHNIEAKQEAPPFDNIIGEEWTSVVSGDTREISPISTEETAIPETEVTIYGRHDGNREVVEQSTVGPEDCEENNEDDSDGSTGGPERHVDTETLAGAHRYETAIEISREHYDQAGTAVIATGEGYADALAGSALAASTRGPVLLNEHGELRNDVDNELDRLGVDHVYILGGEAAISGHVENQLGARGMEVDRLGGATRYETARLIAEEVDKHEVDIMEDETETDTAGTSEDSAKNVFLTTGEGFPDALSASRPAADEEESILLSPSNALSESPEEYLEENRQEIDRITTVGGQAAVSATAENEAATAGDAESQRWAGSTRYWTSTEVARQSRDNEVENVYVATGADYPDALAHGTASATQENSAFLLVPGHNAQALDHVEDFAQDHGQQVRRVIFAGGNAAISGEVKNGVTTIFDAHTEAE